MKTLAIKYSESMLAVLNLSPETFEQVAKTALALNRMRDSGYRLHDNIIRYALKESKEL